MTDIQSIESLSTDLTDLILPWVAVLISAIIAFMLRDFVASLSKGLKFKMNSQFKEGDKVEIIECKPISKKKTWEVIDR